MWRASRSTESIEVTLKRSFCFTAGAPWESCGYPYATCLAGFHQLRPPSFTHIAHVCGRWTIKNPVDAKPRPGLAQVLEQAPPAAEQHGCQGDFQLVNDTHGQVLLDHVGSTRDANITAVCGFPSELEGTLRPVIDEVEGRPTRAHPGFALLMGEDVYRCVERSLLWPAALAGFEHA